MCDVLWRERSTWLLRPTPYEAASAVQKRKGGKMPPPDGLLLLTGWLVGAANLPRLLPKAFNLFHREEARHLDVLLVALPYIATSLPPAAESSCSTAAWRSVLGFSLIAFRACGV